MFKPVQPIMVLLFLLFGLSSCLDSPTESSSDSTDETSNTTEDDSVDDVDDNTTILTYTSKMELGSALFLDENLSKDRTMSCASCHNPDHGFIDDRSNLVDGSVSLGQDGTSLGDRNSPMISYASYIPSFTKLGNTYSGGQFLDGRADDLIEQAQGPFLDASEMQMESKLSVVQRVMENNDYIAAFKSFYGDTVLDDTDEAYTAIADAIAEFEESDEVSPFDSEFDIGALDDQEQRGQALFVELNCNTCHSNAGSEPLFSDYSYQNLGVPENTAVRVLNGSGVDQGLYENSSVTDTSQIGKFKVPSLRNVAVTAPYMHNGVFQELKTVVHFYNTRDVDGAINPETGEEWAEAEVSSNVVTKDIGDLGLSDDEEDDLVAFLKTLTDSKYVGLE